MSFLTANYSYWEFWAPADPDNGFYGPQKVTFDGENKLVIVNADVSTISVKEDIYSNWKEWFQVRDNSKFLAAIRVSGGDPIGGGAYTGDVYFMINGWRIVVDHSCVIDGVIYSDDFPSPFVPITGTQLVTNKVSSLVSTVTTGGATDVPTTTDISSAVWSNPTRTITQTFPYNGPTVTEIRQEIDQNSLKLSVIETNTSNITQPPSAVAIADAVRTELNTELTHLMTLQNGNGLNSIQATMLLEMYRLYGLDPTRPLVVTNTSRVSGDIIQTIVSSDTQTTVTRV